MTTQELIIGHFEHTLTPDEENLLQERLSESAETRAMYDHFRNIDTALSADAAMLAPSAHLDELTVAAALSAVPEVIGGGALSWLGGKLIGVVSAIVVGGLAIAIVSNVGSERSAVPNAPNAVSPAAVHVVPPTPAPAPALSDPGTAAPANTAAQAPSQAVDQAGSRQATSAHQSRLHTAARDEKAATRPLGIDTGGPTINHPTRIEPHGR